MSENNVETIIFGGGCFWCTEGVFRMFKGVSSVESGYSGGDTENPSYDEICTGNTNHAEVVKIDYDPNLISLEVLLEVFFASHNPTTLNRQGNDIGTQYRSVIFYFNQDQKDIINNYIKNIQSEFSDKIVTEVVEYSNFYKAEDYHQNYYENNTNAPYCQIVIDPKIDKIRKKYADLLKK